MQEINNLTQDDVLDLILNFPIKPLRDKVVITTNVEESDGIDLTGNSFSPEQYVLAVGSHVESHIKPGQKISLDLDAMAVKQTNPEDAYNPTTTIMLKPVQVGDKVFGMITANKIEFLYV